MESGFRAEASGCKEVRVVVSSAPPNLNNKEVNTITINEALALQTAVKSRLSELRRFQVESATRKISRYGFGDEQREEIVEPKYDVKAVDRKIVELEAFLFKVDAAVKQANATTQIKLEAEVDKLLAPLE